MATKPEPSCSICNSPKDNHPFRHPFTLDGKLHEPKKNGPQKPPTMMADPIALRLAAKLHEKGILDQADLSEVVLGVKPDGDSKQA